MGVTSREQGRVILDSPVLGRTVTRTLEYKITSAPTGSEQDTGIDLPAKCVVRDVYLDVTAVEVTGATKTIHVGLLASESGGDADGFLAAVSCATTTGLKKGTLLSSGQTRGALLRVDESGAGVLVPEPHLSGSVTAKSISFTAGSADWVEMRGSIYVTIEEIVTL